MGSFFKKVILSAIIYSVATTGVQAHPGSRILTTGSGERTAMTTGMGYEDVKGVHIFRGSTSPTVAAETSAKPAAHKQIEIEISVAHNYRRFRHLRTQGFFSGDAYPSRRYTHGFYSGR